MLWAKDHERTVAEVVVNARMPTAIATASFRLVRLGAPPALSTSPIQNDFDLIVPREIFSWVAPEVRLVSGHNKQPSRHGGRTLWSGVAEAVRTRTVHGQLHEKAITYLLSERLVILGLRGGGDLLCRQTGCWSLDSRSRPEQARIYCGSNRIRHFLYA